MLLILFGCFGEFLCLFSIIIQIPNDVPIAFKSHR